jgi:hypothetical protein
MQERRSVQLTAAVRDRRPFGRETLSVTLPARPFTHAEAEPTSFAAASLCAHSESSLSVFLSVCADRAFPDMRTWEPIALTGRTP